jgi:tetratricopeptide (TPR) repeat protein
LDRAHTIFSRLKDPGNLAQVDETRARVLLAENRYTEAATVIASAVRVFENGGENALLADALSVQGTVSARLGNYNRSVDLLRYAIKVATNAGALESAGQAALSLLEEHGRTRLTQAEIYEAYHRADEFLKNSQDLEDIKRLRACASIVTRRLLGMQLTDPNFSLPAAVHAYEARFVEEALERAEGSVTRAANLLGFKHHGSLAVILKTRHKQLLAKRIPAIPRRRSIIARNTSSKRQPMP